ncbi:hypothetical protein Hamer_G005408, partial [Homarus americanus]
MLWFGRGQGSRGMFQCLCWKRKNEELSDTEYLIDENVSPRLRDEAGENVTISQGSQQEIQEEDEPHKTDEEERAPGTTVEGSQPQRQEKKGRSSPSKCQPVIKTKAMVTYKDEGQDISKGMEYLEAENRNLLSSKRTKEVRTGVNTNCQNEQNLRENTAINGRAKDICQNIIKQEKHVELTCERNTDEKLLDVPCNHTAVTASAYCSVTHSSKENINESERQSNSFHASNHNALLASSETDKQHKCHQLSCLTNQNGQLCTILGEQYILTHVRKITVLVYIRMTVSEDMIVGCRCMWRGEVPILLSELPDKTLVKFDAIALPCSKAFHAVVVWQKVKPKSVFESLDDSYIYIDSRELPVLRFVFEQHTAYVEVKYDDKLVISEFMKDVVFIDGSQTDPKDLSLMSSWPTGTVFATVCRLLRGRAAETLTYTCTCVWSGKRPQRNSIPIELNSGELYKRKPSGKYVRHNIYQCLWCDVSAKLEVMRGTYTLVFCVGKWNVSLGVTQENINILNKKKGSPLSSGLLVKAHVVQIHEDKVSRWRALLVQLVETGADTESSSACTITTATFTTMPQEDPSVSSKPFPQENKAKGVNVSQTMSSTCGSPHLSPQPLNCAVKSLGKNFYCTTGTTMTSAKVWVEGCVWHFSSISQGVVTHSNRSILIKQDKFYVNGEKVLPGDPLAKFSSKSVRVNAFIEPLPHPMEVLNSIVTHRAVVAGQGLKQLNISDLLKSPSDVTDSKEILYKNFSITKMLTHRNCQCSTNIPEGPSKPRQVREVDANIPSVQESNKRSVSYIGACIWKMASISLGIVANNTKIIVVRHDAFYVNQLKVSGSDPLVKFIGNDMLVNVEVTELSSPHTVLGQTVTHEALLAWQGKKPPQDEKVINNYIKRNSTWIEGSSIKVHLSDAGRIILINDIPENSGPLRPRHVLRQGSSTGQIISDATGFPLKVCKDYGILKVHCRFVKETEVLVAFHKSVVYIDKKRLSCDKPLDNQIKISNKQKSWHCSMKRASKISGMNVQYMAKLVWYGKKPTTEEILFQISDRPTSKDSWEKSRSPVPRLQPPERGEDCGSNIMTLSSQNGVPVSAAAIGPHNTTFSPLNEAKDNTVRIILLHT